MVEVGGATGSVTVVVRLTVVVVVVGGGVVTTSSLEQATRQTPTAINGRRRHSVCISVKCFVFAPNDGLLYFGRSRSSIKVKWPLFGKLIQTLTDSSGRYLSAVISLRDEVAAYELNCFRTPAGPAGWSDER